MKRIHSNGMITFGAYRGKHFSLVPRNWLEWACENVSGFRVELTHAKQTARPRTGRKYILRPYNTNERSTTITNEICGPASMGKTPSGRAVFLDTGAGQARSIGN